MTKLIVWIGGIALLAMTLCETLSVIGRHIGMPQRGVIEIIQAAILVAGALALVASTLAGNHARVRLVVDRLSPATQDVLSRLSALLAAVFFTGLLAGSVWIAADLWDTFEFSEIMNVPWRWLRTVANLCIAASILVLLRQALWRRG